MNKVSLYEAKTNLSKLLARTAKGEQITITKHGVSVAMLVPAESSTKSDLRDIVRSLRNFRKSHSLGGMTLREMIDEGRRC